MVTERSLRWYYQFNDAAVSAGLKPVAESSEDVCRVDCDTVKLQGIKPNTILIRGHREVIIQMTDNSFLISSLAKSKGFANAW